MTKEEAIRLVLKLRREAFEAGIEAMREDEGRGDAAAKESKADDTAAKLIAAIEAQWG